MRVFIDREDRTEIENEAQAPGDRTNEQDSGLQIESISNDASNKRRRDRARVLDEVFHRLCR